MERISVRLPDALVAALASASEERGVTRSRLVRAVLEDALNGGTVPDVPPTPREVREEEAQRAVDRMNAIAMGR
jgi:hypothetical protein